MVGEFKSLRSKFCLLAYWRLSLSLGLCRSHRRFGLAGTKTESVLRSVGFNITSARYKLGLWVEQIGDWAEARAKFQSDRKLALASSTDEENSDRFRIMVDNLQELK